MGAFDRSGQPSPSPLARIAAEAAGARRHVAGDACFNTAPDSAVIVPPAPSFPPLAVSCSGEHGPAQRA